MNSRMLLVASLAGLAACGGLLVAGPLAPPAGSVAPSYKTLTDVEPRIAIGPATTPGDFESVYRITQPGSYYLTGNLAGVSGKHGIVIAATNVTIDLNGFAVTGTTGARSGIVGGAQDYLSVRNGIVRNWPETGVHFSTSDHARVQNVAIAQCGESGLLAGVGALIDSCSVVNCTGTGFQVNVGSMLSDCLADGNTVGFELSDRSRIVRSTAVRSVGHGMTTTDGATIEDCVASGNGGNGIEATWGVRITGCNARSNSVHGISFGSYCVVEGCTADANTGAGFYGKATTARAVVKGNNSTRNAQGLKLDGGGSLVLGNTCSFNSTNYVLVTGNRVSAIVTMPLAGAINGNTGGTTLTAPESNFAY